MRIFPLLLLLASMTSSRLYAGPADFDPGYLPIGSDALLVAVARIPLSSNEHTLLIGRSFISRIAPVAFKQYSRLAERNEDNFHANLWAGIASAAYFNSLGPYYGEPDVKFTLAQGQLFQEARHSASKYLRRALNLNPNSGQAHSEFGFWRFYIESDVKEGVEHLKKGITLSPNSPRAHRLYAEALYNPSTKFYQPKVAEAEFKRAVALDANYASPHYGMGNLYFQLKRYPEARAELAAYEKLLPPEARQRPLWLRDALAKVL